MNATTLLLDAYGRLPEGVDQVLAGADDALLTFRPGPEANSVAWLVWHLTRVMDDHVSDVAGVEQTWTADAWAGRFALPFATSATGYGHSADDVAAVRAPADLLGGYFAAVHASTVAYLATLGDGDLDRVVDTRWTPAVTLGVRLVSVYDDCARHLGQAAYVRGLLARRG